MRLDKDKACAIFVDYQERLLPALYKPERFIEKSVTLAKGLIELGIPIIVSEQYPKGLGTTVEEFKSIEGFPEGIAKTTFSCMLEENIVDAVKATGKKQVIVCGCETHICVLQTVIDLIEAGYTVFLISDCVTSRTKKNVKVGIERAKQEGAFISSLESILFEALVRAGSDTFKAISKLIK